jgi:hypothetical protein
MNEEMNRDRAAQLRQEALNSLSSYSGGFAELERIDRQLKAIIRSLKDVADPAWTSLLHRQWGQLEIIYALVLHDGRSCLTEDEEIDVRKIVAGLVAELQNELPLIRED